MSIDRYDVAASMGGIATAWALYEIHDWRMVIVVAGLIAMAAAAAWPRRDNNVT